MALKIQETRNYNADSVDSNNKQVLQMSANINDGVHIQLDNYTVADFVENKDAVLSDIQEFINQVANGADIIVGNHPTTTTSTTEK